MVVMTQMIPVTRGGSSTITQSVPIAEPVIDKVGPGGWLPHPQLGRTHRAKLRFRGGILGSPHAAAARTEGRGASTRSVNAVGRAGTGATRDVEEAEYKRARGHAPALERQLGARASRPGSRRLAQEPTEERPARPGTKAPWSPSALRVWKNRIGISWSHFGPNFTEPLGEKRNRLDPTGIFTRFREGFRGRPAVERPLPVPGG